MCILLLATVFSTPAAASTLQEGDFVRVGRSCRAAHGRDRLASNGHAVSPPGQLCHVVSRTESGGYYPIFNQLCTGGGSDDFRMDVHVSTPERISIRQRPGGRPVAYRYCPSRVIPRAAR